MVWETACSSKRKRHTALCEKTEIQLKGINEMGLQTETELKCMNEVRLQSMGEKRASTWRLCSREIPVLSLVQ